jgi:hypothetical protein
VRYRFIDAEKASYPVRLLFRCLGVSRSGFYAWRDRAPSDRSREDARLKVKIKAFHTASRHSYGSPRIHRDLREEGDHVSRKRVARLMRELGLEGVHKRAYRTTTDSNHRLPVAPNVLMRDFEVNEPDTAWATDITYIRTTEGWLYLAAIMDLFSRRIVGYAMSERIDRALVLDALSKALQQRPLPRCPQRRRPDVQHEPSWQLLGQRGGGELLRDAEDGADLSEADAVATRDGERGGRLHRELLQRSSSPLFAGLSESGGVRVEASPPPP